MRSIAPLLTGLLMLLASCGGSDEPATSDATVGGSVSSFGVELFNERVVGSNPGCVTCHSLEAEIVLVGPSLHDLAGSAGARVPGMAPADYVRQAIVEPDIHIVDGYAAGQMAGGWGELLSTEQIDSLIEFLLGG